MKCLIVFLALSAAMAQPPCPEFFDTGGMPPKPTTLLEQQLLDLIGSHRKGDLPDAARIQGKLRAYYADKGDEERATAAFLRAAAAAWRAAPSRPGPPDTPRNTSVPRRASAGDYDLDGSYFGWQGRTMHTWNFGPDGSFFHSWVVPGARTNVRDAELGQYRIVGGTIVLEIRITPPGGASEHTIQVRRARFKHTKEQMFLDGVELRNRTSW